MAIARSRVNVFEQSPSHKGEEPDWRAAAGGTSGGRSDHGTAIGTEAQDQSDHGQAEEKAVIRLPVTEDCRPRQVVDQDPTKRIPSRMGQHQHPGPRMGCRPQLGRELPGLHPGSAAVGKPMSAEVAGGRSSSTIFATRPSCLP